MTDNTEQPLFDLGFDARSTVRFPVRVKQGPTGKFVTVSPHRRYEKDGQWHNGGRSYTLQQFAEHLALGYATYQRMLEEQAKINAEQPAPAAVKEKETVPA